MGDRKPIGVAYRDQDMTVTARCLKQCSLPTQLFTTESING
jgi:hypothetical protein